MINSLETNQTIDSRIVAEMLEKNHTHLLRDIRKYAGYIAESKVGSGDFFIEDEYFDSNGQKRPYYQITKKGCEFIAHKMTGQKGAIFTAKYINLFHEMESQLMKPQLLTSNEPIKPTLASINTAAKIIMKTLEENQVPASDKLAIVRDLYHQAGIEIPALSHALVGTIKDQKQATLQANFEDLKDLFKDASYAEIQEAIEEVTATQTVPRAKAAVVTMLRAVQYKGELVIH